MDDDDDDDVKFDVEKLIENVRTRRALWDKIHRNYNNEGIKTRLWFDIWRHMQVPTSALRKKWKYLRDQFRVECKKIPADKLFDTLLTADDYKKYVMWPHFGPLSFLKNQMKLRKVKNRYSSSASLNDRDGEDEEENTVESLQQNEPEIVNIPNCDTVIDHADFEKMFVLHNAKSMNADPLPTPVQNKECEAFDGNLQLLEQRTHRRFANNPEEDEDKAFFASLLPHIRTLTPCQKMLCRIDMQNIVYKHVYKHKEEEDTANSVEAAENDSC